ncbi:hypothetical protein FOT43_14545 [Serratia marcescens]|uniref:hypothetical protein n=1 Tax=Serratia marcescens TaxID=615 RepID=UPI00117D82CE|nr:hypothetical protein [Serratia marcescens]TSB27323.1 hypothetical protein FOT43_14545 [Serratia marcescens]TXE39750.1 hypothetical protein FOT60_19605 [Serratia marcescens]
MNKLSELRRLTPRQIAVYRDRVAISDSDYELIPVHTGDLRAMLAELEAKDKRIAELREWSVGLERHVKDIEATLIAATDEVADLTKERDEARAKLATPVRLLGEMLLHDWEHSVERQATFQHRKIAWDARLAEDKKAILAAGFTFTVEGDE